ncbi:hypothetical protein DSO57_1019687 [Entomophthora muscae]|uniref:Uncharacterized protein n=1 Tax=Entomophthora muscae TaxID=34485 RepID=A0ACC2RV64_9FUNG|nr:hypothetical protein DSO57_1019687 [Entomophthora muscae]
MFSWLWPEKKDVSEEEQIQYIYNGIGSFDQKGSLCGTPKFIGPNFSQLADKNSSLAIFPSFSRTIPEEEFNIAKAVASRATIDSTSRRSHGLGAPISSNFNDPRAAPAFEANATSRLRLKAQYIFNEKKQEITQHVSSSLVSNGRPTRTSSRTSPSFEPFSLLKHILVAVGLFLVYFLATSFWHDYSNLLEQTIRTSKETIYKCTVQYTRNKCSSPPPPLVEECERLATCFQADPHAVEKTTLVVKLLGRLVSEFIGVLTLRELSLISLCTFTVLMGSLAIRNFF